MLIHKQASGDAFMYATAKTKVENIIVFFMYLPWTSFHPGFPRCGGDVEKHVKKESSVPSIFTKLAD